jgi:dipeptidyl aminopeptidase/acylaminoacyl peptidase
MGQRLDIDGLLAVMEPAFRVPLDLSPDGTALIVTLKQRCPGVRHGDDGYGPGGVPGEMAGSRVAVVDTDGSGLCWPFGDSMVSWAGRWSPDGRYLAGYVRDQGAACLGIWERESGQVSLHRDVLVRPFFGFEVPGWTPDSAAVVVKIRHEDDSPGETSPAEPRPLVRTFSFDPARPDEGSGMVGWAGGYRADLAVIDVTSGAARRLTSSWRGTGWEVAPDGTRVAALCYRRAEEELQQFRYDLVVLPLRSEGPELVVASEIAQGYGNCFSWSPDASLLAYVSAGRGERARLLVVPSDGSSPPRDITPRDGDPVPLEDQAPRWSAEGDRIFWPLRSGHWEIGLDGLSLHRAEGRPGEELMTWVQSPARPVMASAEKSTLYLATSADSQDLSLLRLNGDGDAITLTGLPGRLAGLGCWSWAIEVSPSGTIYALLEASDHPAELWRLSGGQTQRLMSFNPHLDKVAFGHSTLISYRSLDGDQLYGSLLLPPDFQEETPIPVIVEVYGGGLGSRDHDSFDGLALHRQLLAARGYGVFRPDMPMRDEDPLRQLPGLVLPAVNRLVDLGIADPERIGLMGHSYGGYCTIALLVQTGIFSAAVASAGFYDLASAALVMNNNGTSGWLGWAESGQGRMGGSLWEKRSSYIENSPVFYLDRVTTPVLLTLGTADIVPPAQAEAVYVALRRLGKKVELAEYEGEEHWPGAWTEPAYRDYANRVITWFDQHLRTSA